jgi:hypothetical protein
MPQKPFQVVHANARVRRYGPGEKPDPADYQAGDFILTHGSAFFSHLIRLGQRLRFWDRDQKYTWWNHAALIVSSTGDLIEALGAGVSRSHLTKYAPTEFHLVSVEGIANAHDREQAVHFAEWCVGMPYGWMNIVSIALSLITGGKFTFGFDGQAICSGLVARALERTNAIFNRDPEHIMPADLAKYFNAQPPGPGAQRGGPGKPSKPGGAPPVADSRGPAHPGSPRS